MRISRNGTPLKPVQLMIPAELHRRLELEKGRRGGAASLTSILLEWIQPRLEGLPPAPGRPRIET